MVTYATNCVAKARKDGGYRRTPFMRELFEVVGYRRWGDLDEVFKTEKVFRMDPMAVHDVLVELGDHMVASEWAEVVARDGTTGESTRLRHGHEEKVSSDNCYYFYY